MKKKNSLVFGVVILVLAALVNHYIIHNPKRTIIPEDITENPEQITDSVKRLSDDDQRMLMQYLVRHSMAKIFGKAEPYQPVTIGEAIEKQKNLTGDEDKQEAKKQKLKSEVEQDQAAKIAEVNKAVTVSYLGKKLTHSNYQDFIELHVAYQNNTAKDIQGIKGKYVFKDLFGDKIIGIIYSMDSTIKAGDKHIEKKGGLDYNQFVDDHQRLAATPDDKIKFEYIP